MSDKNRELTSRLRGQLMECAGWDMDVIAGDRKRAHDYYFMRQRSDEVEGRSNVVSGDISAMVEANLSQMLDAFDSANIGEFDATGPEDDSQAELESATVTKFVMKDNNGYQEVGAAVKDALLIRNGFFKVWVEEDERAETANLENASVEAIAELDAQPAVTNVDVLAFNRENKTAKLRVTTTLKRFRAEALPPENFLYLRDWHKIDLQEIPFCAERHVEPRSELLRRGFPNAKVSKLKAWHEDNKFDGTARNVRNYPEHRVPLDDSQDLILWYECFVLMDSGNGISERRRIALAGTNQTSILENEPVSVVNYCSGSAFISPHRLTGLSLYDKLKQTQDITTGLNRALLDGVNTAIKNRTFYLDGKVNVDDLDDGRPNNNVRVRAHVGDVNKAVTTQAMPDLSQGILRNIEHQKQNRTELGGASLELATGQMQMAGGRIGSEGVDRAFSVMEQLAAHMTKNMATSLIRNLWLLAHMVIRANFDTPVNVKVNGRWKSPTPSDWTARTAVTIKPGMSPGERARQVAAIDKVIDTQLALAERDMDDVLVNIEGFYKALTDRARLSDVPNPEQYYVDPATPPAQQALKKKEAAQAQNAEAQRALMSQAVGLEQLRAGLDKYKADQKTQLEYWTQTLRAEIEEAKIVGAATAELVKAKQIPGDTEPEIKANGSGASDDAGE